MEERRTKLVVTLSWLLFWSLMVSVAVQDYLRNEARHDLWRRA